MRIEGVAYKINWRGFKRGTSFFVPCLNHTVAVDAIQRITRRHKFEVVTKVVIEESIRGVRVWRL